MIDCRTHALAYLRHSVSTIDLSAPQLEAVSLGVTLAVSADQAVNNVEKSMPTDVSIAESADKEIDLLITDVAPDVRSNVQLSAPAQSSNPDCEPHLLCIKRMTKGPTEWFDRTSFIHSFIVTPIAPVHNFIPF